MMSERMIAPCGLNCSICKKAVRKENPCAGCLGPNENKPEFCSLRCQIIHCERRINNNYQYCDECPVYPCEVVMERENRYMSKYVLKESPITNLKIIREKGMKEFLALEKKKWTCKDCGGIISVHEGICSSCGKEYKI